MLAIYFIMWWLVFFAVLPWGVRSQQEDAEVAPGTDPGAPAIPNLRRKLVWTTLVSVMVFSACYLIYVDHLITLDSLLAPFGPRMIP